MSFSGCRGPDGDSCVVIERDYPQKKTLIGSRTGVRKRESRRQDRRRSLAKTGLRENLAEKRSPWDLCGMNCISEVILPRQRSWTVNTPPSISQMPRHSHLWRHLPPCGSLQAQTALLSRLQKCEPVAANLCRAGARMYWPNKRIQVGYQLHLLQCSRNSFWDCENDSAVLFVLRISVNKAPSLLSSLSSSDTLVN